MRLARLSLDHAVYLARLEDDTAVLLHQESTHPAADALREALLASVDLEGQGLGQVEAGYRLLAPVRNPSKFFGVGLNYADHAREGGHEAPENPVFFLKTPNTIIGPGEPIRFDPEVTDAVDYEVELVVIIGRTVSPGDEIERPSILGYTVGNDVTARDAQLADVQWPRSKCYDTFAPLGPWIVSADDFNATGQRLWCDVSGERMQDSFTSNLVFDPEELVRYLSRSITLEPGDLITTGTPAGVGFARTPPRFLRDGDYVEVGIDGIGTLANPVIARSRGRPR